MVSFKEKILQKKFVITCEFVPGRGLKGSSIDAVIEFGQEVKEKKLPIDAISITDNPGGNPSISPDVLGKELLNIGIEPLIHFSCANNNRNNMEARLWDLSRQGLNNLLVVTGDYPTSGYQGVSKPVFDLDSVQLIGYINQLNKGLEIPGRKKTEILSPTNFVIGCAVSPFKKTEEELLTQFIKLEKKISQGADFVVSQLGYDIRKFVEIQKYLKYQKLNIPILGNVYVLSLTVAELMNKNLVPGCVVTDEFLEKLKAEAKAQDKGKQARLERAAQMMAIFKGLNFNGVHIGGFGLKFADFEFIISRALEIENNWQEYLKNFQYSQPNEFYLFKENTFNKTKKFRPSLSFKIMKGFHNLMFESLGYKIGKKIYPIIEKISFLNKICYYLERICKQILFDCQECGDCALVDIGYLCPMSGCAKFQRNGPCGGSYQGFCEVHKEKQCLWTKIYKRLSSENKLNQIKEKIVPAPDASLLKTSSWANFFMNRDHTSKKIINKMEEK